MTESGSIPEFNVDDRVVEDRFDSGMDSYRMVVAYRNTPGFIPCRERDSLPGEQTGKAARELAGMDKGIPLACRFESCSGSFQKTFKILLDFF